jgi:hypothetical protein
MVGGFTMKASKVEEKQLNTMVPKSIKKAVEKFAVDSDTKLKKIIAEALVNHLKANGVEVE